jgi:hypothetical protein
MFQRDACVGGEYLAYDDAHARKMDVRECGNVTWYNFRFPHARANDVHRREYVSVHIGWLHAHGHAHVPRRLEISCQPPSTHNEGALRVKNMASDIWV